MTDAEILESTYFDRCNIKRKEKIKNPNTGITETVDMVIAENVKCALSKSDNQVMSGEGVGNLSFNHKLFLNPSIDIKEGDTIEVNRMGKISIYLASKPFYYPSHIEVIVIYKERV